MKPELENKLINKYPRIFKQNNPPVHPFDQWGFESWQGWYDLIDRTAAKIQEILDNDKDSFFNTLQNKSKFAALRWYFESDDKNRKLFNKIIDEAEKESFSICEKCGTNDDVSQNKKGYIFTLCDECRELKKYRPFD